MDKQLTAEQKTIYQVFSAPRVSFLIPDYQRPYSWEREQCETLWNDIKDFAFPNDNCDDFNDSDTYFLGTILTFPNFSNEYEVIDGQQRLVTFLLLLRAFYDAFGKMQDSNAKNVLMKLEECIWNTDRFGNPDQSSIKVISEVIIDTDNDELKKITVEGKSTKGNKSNYAKNYCYFQECIKGFIKRTPDYFSLLPLRILNNCVLLPIRVDSRETALQIFTTLNDRGMPLSDTDILKAKFYKFYSTDDEKNQTLSKIGKTWKNCVAKSFILKKAFLRLKNYSRRTCTISKPKKVPELQALKVCESFTNKVIINTCKTKPLRI